MQENNLHIPVLLDEMLEHLAPEDGKTYVDGTFGAGGYTKALLESANCRVYAIDRDPNVKHIAEKLMEDFPGRLEFIEGNFGDVGRLLGDRDVGSIDGIVLDVGVSSMQIDEAGRGFSFSKDGPLDMRMSVAGVSAADIVNEMDEKSLADIIYQFGGERKSRRIAKAIVEARAAEPIVTTGQLSRIIHNVIRPGKEKIDPSTRTFQALRIWVNNELEELKKALGAAEDILAIGGKIVIISFHSLEDSIVKSYFKEKCGLNENVNRHMPDIGQKTQPIFELISRGAVKPSKQEIENNIRSRSARLRAAVKIRNGDAG